MSGDTETKDPTEVESTVNGEVKPDLSQNQTDIVPAHDKEGESGRDGTISMDELPGGGGGEEVIKL